MKTLVNDLVVDTGAPRAAPALDFIRGELGLVGTKEGCREGDCGACAVLVAERLPGGGWSCRAAPSCLLALGEIEGRHLITIEGLVAGARQAGLADGLSPVMRALLEENGSQCGFCSPGVVVSLTGWLLAGGPVDLAGAIRAVEGNLCRCTGYGSIRRAAARLAADFASLPADPDARLAALEKTGVVPASLGRFVRGDLLPDSPQHAPAKRHAAVTLGGGTDFYVRNPDPEAGFEAELLDLRREYAGIGLVAVPGGQSLELGAAVTVRDFFASPAVRGLVPGIESFEGDMASSLIRGRATLGGNVANASPVADMTAILLALEADVIIEGGAGRRELPLQSFFLGYKKLDLREGEIIAAFRIKAKGRNTSAEKPMRFSFEKVSKRRRLDIASVNSALRVELAAGGPVPRIAHATLSAGGVAATPLVLARTGAFLSGKAVDAALVREAAAMAAAEISPISDVRGSADYRRRLLSRLVLGHFIRIFPETSLAEELLP
jgi:xanthine dehydrogenase small subunit